MTSRAHSFLVLLIRSKMFQLSHLVRATRGHAARAFSTCEVALVGCGVPKRGMGCVADAALHLWPIR